MTVIGHSPAQQAPREGVRILVVDDDHQIRDMFHLILSCRLPCCRVDAVVGGREAVTAFKDVRYSVIVMDLRMSDMDGLQAFREIEAHCRRCGWEVPAVVFITGFDPPAEVLALVEKDSRHGLLKKPLSPADLLVALRPRIRPPCPET